MTKIEKKTYKGDPFFFDKRVIEQEVVFVMVILLFLIPDYLSHSQSGNYFWFYSMIGFLIILSAIELIKNAKSVLTIDDEGMVYDFFFNKVQVKWDEVNFCHDNRSFSKASLNSLTFTLYQSGKGRYGLVFKHLEQGDRFFDSKIPLLFSIPHAAFHRDWRDIKKQVLKKMEIKH